MSRRFKNLKAALTFLRSPTADSDTPVPDAPAGTILKNFQDYASGRVATTRNGNTQGPLDNMAVAPFATAATDPKYRVPISNNAAETTGTFGVNLELLGLTVTDSDTITARGFSPAKAVIMRLSGQVANPESQITGRRYRRKLGGARVFPFGQTTTNPLYSAQKTAVATAVEIDSDRSVSFIPEKF